MMVNGKMINTMERERKYGQAVISSSETSKMEQSMEKDQWNGKVVTSI